MLLENLIFMNPTPLRTEVRGDFNIHGTKYFQYAVFLQKSPLTSVLNANFFNKNYC